MQIKTTMRYHLTAVIETIKGKCWQRCEEIGNVFMFNGYLYCELSVYIFFLISTTFFPPSNFKNLLWTRAINPLYMIYLENIFSKFIKCLWFCLRFFHAFEKFCIVKFIKVFFFSYYLWFYNCWTPSSYSVGQKSGYLTPWPKLWGREGAGTQMKIY